MISLPTAPRVLRQHDQGVGRVPCRSDARMSTQNRGWIQLGTVTGPRLHGQQHGHLALNDRRHWRSQSPLQRYSKVNRAPGETPGTSLTLGDHPYARQWLIEARGERRTAPTTRRTDSLLIYVLGLS